MESIDYWWLLGPANPDILRQDTRIQPLNCGPSGIAGLAGVVALFQSPNREDLLNLLQITEDSFILVVNTEGG